MLRGLISTCLRHRSALVIIVLLGVMLGIDRTRALRIDAFPEFAPPRVEVQTEAPGLSTLEVESLVTRPIEEALAGIPGAQAVRSKSVLGLSSVIVLFDSGTDLLVDRQLVQERLTVVARQLPQLAAPPTLRAPTSSTSRILKIGMRSDDMSITELGQVARWTVRPRLMAIPGVANVAVWGERRPELQVLVDPEQLSARGLALDQVVRATGEAVSPITGGFVENENQRFAVSELSTASTVEELARQPLGIFGGTPLTLGEAAEVAEGHAPLIGDAVIDGGPGLLLIVEKQPWGNTVEITEKIDAALADLQPALGGIEVDPTIFRSARFIRRAVDNLQFALIIGCGLVVLVLVIFLFDWRSALISAVAIPVSLLTTVGVLGALGITMDTMVLAGLAIAMGEVVDDAIIDVENIHRRLGERWRDDPPTKVNALRVAASVVLEASLEVRSSVVFASLIVVMVFVPVAFLGGLAGAFFRPLAIAYVLAIAASLAVALTLTPALSLLLLPGGISQRATPSPIARGLSALYEPALRRLLAAPRAVSAGALCVLLFGVVGYASLGSELLPDFREQDFLMHWIAKPGASIPAVQRTAALAERELLEIPGVRNAGAHIGRAEVADEVVGPNFAELWVSVDDDADHERTVRAIEETVARYPGLYRDVQTYLRESVDEVLTGGHSQLTVRVFGPDLAVLGERAEVIATAMREVSGTKAVAVEQLRPVPEVQVRPRPEAAEVYGLSNAALRRQVTTLLQGTQVGEVVRDQRPYAVVVRGVDAVRDDVTSVRDLRIEAPDGSELRLGDVADVMITPAPGAIRRESGSRRLDVTCDVEGRAVGDVAAEIETRLREVAFPAEHHAELLGEHLERRAAAGNLAWGVGLALAGIFLILYLDFRDLRATALVGFGLPFALVGGVVVALGTSGTLSLGALVGFVTLIGVAARNGIMLVSSYRRLELDGVPFGTELVVRGTLERLSAILMTACSTGLALVPLALWGDRPGHEIEHPMALVILGGLVGTTVLNLVVTPVVYAAWVGGRWRRQNEEDALG